MLALKNNITGRFVSTQTLEERFWEKVDKRSDIECWIWKASTNRQGYGQLWCKNTFLRASRVSWVIHFGEIPNGKIVCHNCDNPSCVNPKHLFLGSYQDNIIDMINKGRGANQSGENNGFAKLTKTDVDRIRSLWNSGVYRQKEIMKMFMISRVTLWRIIHYKSWVN